MSSFLISLCILTMPADSPESVARAAFALLTAKQSATKQSECGKCRTDLAECRKEALIKDKPLIILVNTDCKTNAAMIPGAIFVKVTNYKEDGEKEDKPRIVFVTKNTKKGILEIEKTLPPLDESEMKKEVFKCFPKLTPTKTMSWV